MANRLSMMNLSDPVRIDDLNPRYLRCTCYIGGNGQQSDVLSIDGRPMFIDIN
jgi:hypothetical protein